MDINWKAVGVGLIVTLILGIILSFVGILNILAPIIGGIVAGYMLRGNYTTGAVNGGLGAAVAGFLVTLIAVLLGSSVISAALVSSGFTGDSAGLIGLATIVGAIVSFIVFFILGAIGGIIGILIKGKETV